MTDETLDRCRRQVADRLLDVLRKRHPELAFQGGVLEGGRFRPFSSGPTQALRLEPGRDEPEPVAAPYPDDTDQAA